MVKIYFSYQNCEKKLLLNPVQRFGSSLNLNVTCHLTSITPLLFTEQEAKTLETGRADRQYRAKYELFNYFYRNYFLPRNFNSVTNNSNNSYDKSDKTRI